MGKWLIVYSSVTGNTKMVAEAMGKVVKEVDIFAVQEAPADLSSYELILAGYWLRRGGPDPKMARFLAGISNKVIALFQTHGAATGSEHAVTAFARAAALLGAGCTMLGTFGCQGRIQPALIERRQQAGPEDPHGNTAANIARWAAAASHPDAADLLAAQAFVKALQRKLLLQNRFTARAAIESSINK